MTIKKKIFTSGLITFFIFVVLALMNIWTHQQVISTLEIRDEVNGKLADIEEFAKWKNELIRSISDVMASGHVPPLAREHIDFPYKSPASKSDELVRSARRLISLIGERESAAGEIERTFDALRQEINGLYYQLDKEIATVLALAQMDQVMGKDSSEINSLAPYVLKSLNQLTLVALNSLISRNYTEEGKGVVARNRRFLSAQLATIDSDGGIAPLFEQLFALIGEIDKFILESSRTIDKFDAQIPEAKRVFDKAVYGSEIGTALAGAQVEAERANDILEKASRRTLITVIVFLFVVPVLVIVVGIVGLNTVIVGPINHLVAAMKNVESGSFDVEASVKTHDEIGILARAFNAMAVEIKAKVTEMSRLNQTLKENEAKYRTLVDNLPQRIFLKNLDSAYVSCNRNYARDQGIEEADLVGKTDFDFFPKHLAEKYREDDVKVFRTETTIEVEESYFTGGEEIIIQTVKTPIRNEQGQVSGVLGIFWDITERKHAEEALHLARFSLENASVAIFWINSEGMIQFVNERACQMVGYSRDELVPMHLWEIAPDFSPTRYAQYWNEISDGEPHFFETVYRHKDGSRFPVEISVRQGEFKGVRLNFAFVNDISGRRQTEEEKQKLLIQLQQSRKMEAIGTLAGGIAHDFNNLLQAINGYTQIMLLDKEKDDPDYAKLKAIDNAGNRAGQLVRQLLLFSRKVEAEKKPVQLNHEIEQARKMLKRTIPKMVEIEFYPDPELWAINADPLQVEQILLNLGSNAADAMPEGGKLIIRTENIPLDQEYDQNKEKTTYGKNILLTVSDTGHGIDRETVEHIFEPFYTTKEIGKGTGLGLASVYGIVKSHGGNISCQSEIGKGTVFKIYFPAIEKLATHKEIGGEPPTPLGKTETILLVDDEAPIRDFASQALKKFNYNVLTASDGETALEIFTNQSREIDLVILDIGMPGMGGHRCLQEIIRIKPSARVLVASGYSLDNQLKKTLEAGTADYVAKPYQLTKLLKKVQAILNRPE